MTQTQYTELVNTVKAHDYHYFIENRPQITDEEYDRLYFQLQDYEQQHPEQVLPDSPTQCAHAEVKNGHKQIKRRTPMLSTEKAQSVEKVEKWMRKTSKALSCDASHDTVFTVEWKYDGISCSLVYQDGKLIEASYGKGIEGNDCLELCKQVASIPNEISASGRVEVRGEMVVPFANLQRTGYKNCRSAASGIMADTATTMANCLEFYPYYIDADILEGATREYQTQSENLCCLANNSLYGHFLSGGYMEAKSIDEIADIITYAEGERTTLSFPTDGLVVKLNRCSLWSSLGQTAHHPKYAIAYKFAAATAETTITRIEVTTGATGKRTPVAYFEPIIINGSTFQKASLVSEKRMQELNLKPGDKVVVSLRNDVVPYIENLSPTLSEGSPSPALPVREGEETSQSNSAFIGTSESGENPANGNLTSQPQNLITSEPCNLTASDMLNMNNELPTPTRRRRRSRNVEVITVDEIQAEEQTTSMALNIFATVVALVLIAGIIWIGAGLLVFAPLLLAKK